MYVSRCEDETNIEIIGQSTRLGFQFTPEGNSWALVSMDPEFNGFGELSIGGIMSLVRLLVKGTR